MADVQIVAAASSAAPKDYDIPQTNDLQLIECYAEYDGSSASTEYLPALEIISDSGHTVGIHPFIGSTNPAAGASVTASWFPWCPSSISTTATPPDNPLGKPFIWYDFADTSTITTDGSGNITKILDKSGYNNTGYAPTLSQAPGQTTVNGNNAALMDHTAFTEIQSITFTETVTSPITLFWVISMTYGGALHENPGAFTSTQTAEHPFFFNASYTTVNYFAVGSTHTSYNLAIPYTQQQFTGVLSAPNSYLCVNGNRNKGTMDGTTLTQLTLGTQQVPDLPGETDHMSGAFCEFIGYFTDLGGEATGGGNNIQAIEAYLKAKWGTP